MRKMILEKSLLLITSFSTLYLFYQEEKKTVWYQIIVERPKFGFLIPFFLVLFTLLLLFLINPFVFYFFLFLGVSLPFVYSSKEEEINEHAFFTFALFFIYKYFFYLGIFLSSFLFLLQAPIELWILSFMQIEGEVSQSMFGIKGLFQEVYHAKGAQKIDKMVAANKQTTEVFHETNVNSIQPIIKPLVSAIQNESIETKTTMKSGFLIKIASQHDKVNNYVPKHSEEKLLLQTGWNDFHESLFRKHVPEKQLYAVTERWVVETPFFKEYAFQNEGAISQYVKYAGNNKQDETMRFGTDIIKHLAEGSMFANSKLPLTEILETIYMDDNKPKLYSHFRNSAYVEDNKGLVESCGQDIRFLSISKNDVHNHLERPLEGNWDFQGSFFILEGNFENKSLFYHLTDTPAHIKSAKDVCDNDKSALKFLKISVSKHSSVQKVFSSNHEAMPVIDITQPILLVKHHNLGSPKEIVDLIHNFNNKAIVSVANGRPVAYIFQISATEYGFFIKK